MENKVEMHKKRIRSSNWDEDEKRLLRQLVTDRIDIVENKDCRTNTHMKKKAAWQEILSSFNSLNKKQRDMTQLVTQWRNTKGQIKSRESQYQRARLMTGGGPPPPSPPPEDLEIIKAIPNEFVVDTNSFDSDGLFIKTMKQAQIMDDQNTKPDSELSLTLVPNLGDQYIDSEKSVQNSDSLADEEIKLASTTPPSTPLQSTPLSSTSVNVLKDNNIKRKLYKLFKKQNRAADEDYEKQLFLLAKRSKENMERRDEELHKKRMIILDLEQRYWEKKIAKLDN